MVLMTLVKTYSTRKLQQPRTFGMLDWLNVLNPCGIFINCGRRVLGQVSICFFKLAIDVDHFWLAIDAHDAPSLRAAPRIWRWGGGSMHWKVGSQYSKNTNIWKRWGMHEHPPPQFLLWRRPCPSPPPPPPQRTLASSYRIPESNIN